MKRSEALEQLKYEIDAILYFHERNELNRDEAAHLVMNCIEYIIGMLPPRFKREATENEIKNDDEKEFIFINEWESEDETK